MIYRPDYLVDIDVYHTHIGIFRTKKTWNRWLKQRQLDIDLKGSAAYAAQLIDTNGTSWFVAYLPDDSTDDMLVHEAAHLTFYILDCVGVPYNSDNSEAFAYLQQTLFRKIIAARKALAKNKKR